MAVAAEKLKPIGISTLTETLGLPYTQLSEQHLKESLADMKMKRLVSEAVPPLVTPSLHKNIVQNDRNKYFCMLGKANESLGTKQPPYQ